jgi:hypothetical protein
LGAAREGLLGLSVEVGFGVLRGLLEEEVDELVGPKGRWNPGRTAVRHGHESRPARQPAPAHRRYLRVETPASIRSSTTSAS